MMNALTKFLSRFSKQQLLTLIGVVITAFTALAAISISLYQQGRGPLAPTAPGSNPSASTVSSDSCTVVIDVPSDSAIFCDKKAYLDEFDNAPGAYHLRNRADTYRAGENLVWSIDITNNSQETVQISLSDVLSGTNLGAVEFLDSDCGANAYDPATKTLTCPAVSHTAGQVITRNFRVHILNSALVGTAVTNVAQIHSGDITTQCSSVIRIVAEAGAQECNEICETDKECADPLRCVDTGDGDYRCRLPENPNNDLCEPEPTPTNVPSNTPTATPGQGGPTATPTTQPSNTPTSTPVPTNTPIPTNTPRPTNTPVPTNTPTATPGTGGPTATPTTQPSNTPIPTNTPVPTASATLPPGVTPSATPLPSATPTPAVGCNESCTSNADCSNASHFCFNDNGNYVCRLDSNPTSTVCAPVVNATSTPAPTGTQTPTLPLAGNNNTTTVILVTAGVIVLILGALGLLFLL